MPVGLGTQPLTRCVKRVVVIGAGIAGLQVTRRLLSTGVNVLCLESAQMIGGVWAKASSTGAWIWHFYLVLVVSACICMHSSSLIMPRRLL